MADLNLNCKHIHKEQFGNSCTKCSAIWVKCHESGQKIFTLKYKNFNSETEVPPQEMFSFIEKTIGYKLFFKKVKTNMSDFYKKARLSCVKFIKKLAEEYKFSMRSYVLAVFYLDLIYLNYDYLTILKDFKSELISIGCFLVAVKFIESKIEIPNYKTIKMFTFKELNYEINEVRKYEDYVLKFLSFKLNYFTTYSILELILTNGIIFNNEFNSDESNSIIKEKVKKTNKYAFQILSIFIEDTNFVNFNHIEIAFSCATFAKDIMKFKNVFPVELERFYNIKMGNFVKCYQYAANLNKKLKSDMSEKTTVIGKEEEKEKKIQKKNEIVTTKKDIYSPQKLRENKLTIKEKSIEKPQKEQQRSSIKSKTLKSTVKPNLIFNLNKSINQNSEKNGQILKTQNSEDKEELNSSFNCENSSNKNIFSQKDEEPLKEKEIIIPQHKGSSKLPSTVTSVISKKSGKNVKSVDKKTSNLDVKKKGTISYGFEKK